MPSKVFSAAIVGLDAQVIEVETDVSFGLRRFNIVGLPDKAVDEAKERVGAAIKCMGLSPPNARSQRVLVNLAPADLKKGGSIYDFSIALSYLLESKQVRFNPKDKIFIGELGLDGFLRPIKGAISFALLAKEQSCPEIILPKANAAEAALISSLDKNTNLKAIGAESLAEAIRHLEGREVIPAFKIKNSDFWKKEEQYPVDLSWIKGQYSAKRALEIAAAGGHNLLMFGPPGTGKSLLAKAIPSILPRLSFEEILEVTKIYSVAGMMGGNIPLINFRPFRSPHHNTSEAALIGGGNPPRPGEITLAHRGVLFLDEFPEFHRDVLESLRQPLEDGRISILRAKTRLNLPAQFTLVAASNPCPCGFRGDAERPCQCTNSQISKYKRKLSGPLMDRMDLFVEVGRVDYEKLNCASPGESSAQVREKVECAREIQKQRFLDDNLAGRKETLVNSEMEIPQIKKYCAVDSMCRDILRQAVNSGKLSARGYHRVLKTARTIADLDSSQNISQHHLGEALGYRTKEESI